MRRLRASTVVSTLLLVGLATGCATVGKVASGLGTVVSDVVKELAADTSSKPDVGKAAERALTRRSGDTTDVNSSVAKPSPQPVPACTVFEYDDYFGKQFELYANIRASDGSNKRIDRAITQMTEGIARSLAQACKELNDRLIAGDEPFQGKNTAERAANLLMRRDAGWAEVRREFPAFRAWVRQVSETTP